MDQNTCEIMRHQPHFLATFTPRSHYRGKPMLPDLAQHAGAVLKVRLLWQMDESDPYPGEWAVGSATDDPEILNRAWIASGDLTLFNVPAHSPASLIPA
jgi:hypothetical protein